MASSSPTPSWPLLAHLRKRGQRPAAAVFVTDHDWQRRHLVASGGFVLPLPEAADAYLVAGLDVILIATHTERTVEAAQQIAASNPRYMGAYWRGQGLQVVIGEAA